MKAATKAGAKENVLTSDDVERMMEAAAGTWDKRLDLRGRTIVSIELKDRDIPVSLDFEGAIILGDVLIRNARFTGTYISFDGAVIKGRLALTSLGNRKFSLYLRHTRIMGAERHERAVRLCAVSLNWLCIGGLRIGRGLKQIGLCAVTFENAVSLEPSR